MLERSMMCTERLRLISQKGIKDEGSVLEITEFLKKNKTHFEKYDLEREDIFYTDDYQEGVLESEQKLSDMRRMSKWYILKNDGTNELIGIVAFYHLQKRDENGRYGCELSYRIGKEYEGQGYVHEALNELIPYMREYELLDFIEADIEKDNERSKRLAESLRESFPYLTIKYV